MSASSVQSRPTAGAALLGAALVAGWIAHDLCILATSYEPHLVLRVLPASAVVILLGGAVGAVVGASRALAWSLFGLVVAGAVLARLFAAEIAPFLVQLPRAFAILLIGGVIGTRWWRSSNALAFGFPLGAMLGAAFLGLRKYRSVAGFDYGHGYEGEWVGLVVLAAGAAALFSQWSLSRARVLVPMASAVVVVGTVLATAGGRMRLPRADLATKPLPGEPRQDPERPNLVVITLDTVRADRLALYGHARVTTPELEAFARHTRVYTSARSTSSWTLPSHASIFTGLLPGEHGAVHPPAGREEAAVALEEAPAYPLRENVRTMASLLAEQGYDTAAIVANSAYLNHHFGLDRGFAHYDDRAGALLFPRFGLVQLAGLYPELGRLGYRDAERIADLAIRWLSGRDTDRPFFLFLNFMDAHGPYLPPRPFDAAFSSARPRDPLRPPRDIWPLLYDRSLLYLDHHLARVLSWLERWEGFEETVIVVTSDHGEAFGEHDFWRHNLTLYESVIRVPLLVKPLRRSVGGARIPEAVSGDDVYRLTLRELGVESLRPEREPEVVGEWYGSAVFAENEHHRLDRDLLTWLEGSYKIIVDSNGGVSIYDLATDPAESRDLATERDFSLQRYRESAAQWWSQRSFTTLNDALPDLDPEVERRLRALGYVK